MNFLDNVHLLLEFDLFVFRVFKIIKFIFKLLYFIIEFENLIFIFFIELLLDLIFFLIFLVLQKLFHGFDRFLKTINDVRGFGLILVASETLKKIILIVVEIQGVYSIIILA